MKSFIMVLLLAFAGEAFAEFGWALWQRHPHYTGQGWFPNDGFASLRGCKIQRTAVAKRPIEYWQEQQQNIKIGPDMINKISIIEPDKSFRVFTVAAGQPYVDHVCLPNGTDPR